MGQQQLLLVILVTIIVGIATVVAINTFSSAADSANLDAVRQDVASIAASAQGYYMKPDMLGGGGQDFDGMTFENIAFGGTISSSGMIAWNENGTYVLSDDGSATGITITAHPASDDNYDASDPENATATNSLSAEIQPDGLSWGS
ncbi:hypothetical protein NC796_10670 [Aliifodinibius sp. S!AR15-10]|uniref:hypothetical protein n=1 Tax=Aliifodinibius sp. S!AR15-10 TaxID=2950437 RepID=UPI00285892FB|nr:hypothetical protein [Aliifodinibius sp. S!AR15-10]MDR8391606.1 hypothetical protein [Aliifodinibius sp. S!AR15-10]